MKKSSEKIIQSYLEARNNLVMALHNFSKDPMAILFDKWNLKMVVDHITEWDNYMLEVVDALIQGKEPPNYGDLDAYNHNSVQKNEPLSWEESLANFEDSSNNLFMKLSDQPDEILEKTFWKGKTLLKLVKQVSTSHYNAHLRRILAVNR